MQAYSSGGVRVAMASALMISGAAALWAQQAGPGQTPTFRSGVELVAIDVGVFDRQGRPVRNLAAADFTVTVAGDARRVVSAEFVDASPGAVAERDAADRAAVSSNEGAGLGRMFVFVVDQNTLEPGSVRHVSRAASRFFSTLSFADRSALMLMPSGPNLDFTWAHDRVRDGLQRVTGFSSAMNNHEFGSLSEARDIANRNPGALRNAAMRECNTSFAGGGFDASSPGAIAGAPAGAGGGGTSTQGTTPAGQGGTGTAAPATGQSGGGRSPRQNSGMAADSCSRDLQLRAEWAWRSAYMTSLSSVTAFRQTLAALARVPGDKSVILISGGWPLEERDQTALLASVAQEAAAARTTLFTLFVPGSTSSASRRLVSTTPTNDQWIQAWPLETLAGMTGGGSFRAEVSADAAFERLAREMSGYYRIGVEKAPVDADGRSRKMKVQVSSNGASVRARDFFDVRTYQDRDWAARLANALDAPIPASGLGLRVTSYLAADPDDASRLKLVLTGEASRLEPGAATVQLLVRDGQGKKVLAGEHPVGEPIDEGLHFSANVRLPPSDYVVRVAVIDGAGRVGSVDHRVDVHGVAVGGLTATGPLLIRVPGGRDTTPRLALSTVRQDERLALQLDLEGEGTRLADVGVTFEIAATADGPALIDSPAELSRGQRGGWVLAQSVADVRVLPPGAYVARAKVTTGSAAIGDVRRAFTVIAAPSAPGTVAAAGSVTGASVSTVRSVRAVVSIPPFALEQAMAPQVLGGFLERVAARPDAAAPMIRDLVARARSAGVDQVAVSDTLAAEYPVAAFLRGLNLLSQNKLEHAANAFRGAMRGSADFYPAMVYLGVCYAAGGNDKDASGAWRTALIKEGDALPLHLLLTDALLRQGKSDLALQTVDSARARWGADGALQRRLVLAALQSGEYADGLQTLDELVASRADDEASLSAGLLVLYESFVNGRPVETIEQDRARMTRLADLYRARGYAGVALLDTWLAEVAKRR